MSFWKKLGRGIKKVLPFAGAAAAFIPGVGPAIGGALSGIGSKIGDVFGGTSTPGMGDPNQGPQPPKVEVSAPGQGANWSALGSAALGYLGQQQTNAANAKQAQAQMDFQAQQSATSYQRATADMKAAGLNPLLAYSQGGASSGAGASAQMGNEIGAGQNSAFSAMQTLASLDNMFATNDQIKSQTANIDADTSNKLLEPVILRNRGEAGKWDYQLKREELNRLQLGNYITNQTMNDTLTNAKATAEAQTATARQREYQNTKERVYSDYYKSSMGKYEPYSLAIQQGATSAANVLHKLKPWSF